MIDSRSTGRPDKGSGGEKQTIPPSTTAEDVLAALKRQGISDLESLAEAALAKVREEAEGDDAPTDPADFKVQLCIFDHYVFVRAS